MPELDEVENLEAAITDATSRDEFANADVLFQKLGRLTDRNSDFTTRHAKVVIQLDDLPRAATMLRKAVRQEPENWDARTELGKVYFNQKRISEAEQIFREITDVDPDNTLVIRHLIQCLQNDDETRPEAEGLVKHSLELDPNNAGAWIQLGAIHANDQSSLAQSAEAFERAIELAPGSPTAIHNYALVKRLQGELDTAEKFAIQSCELRPEDSNYAFTLALCYMFKEDMKQAQVWLEKAIELDPGNNAAHVYLAFNYFHTGKIKKGWAQYEKRLDLQVFKSLNYGRPRWDGEELNGKPVLLLREQGMGDNIQFIRYAKLVAEKGGKVVVLTWPKLQRLFESVEGISVVTTGIPEPKHFYRYAPLLSLPYTLGTVKKTIPSQTPYLRAPAELIKEWRKKLQDYDGIKIGVVWRGSTGHENDRFRSSTLDGMSQLFSVPGTTFFSLMTERPDNESELPKELIDLGPELDDFADTAAAIEALDLVISVDTSVCHLAGALGRPVWTMIARGPDFRWGLKGTKSDWYPSMKLYRQKTLNDWSDVYDRLEKDLKKLVNMKK